MEVQTPRGQPIFAKEDCSPLDIGVVLNDVKTFSDAEKLHFIENVWTPRNDLLFEFPSTVESGKKEEISTVFVSTILLAGLFEVFRRCLLFTLCIVWPWCNSRQTHEVSNHMLDLSN